MILSFHPQFKEKIISGEKIHTIRLDPHNRWKPGMKIHFATDIRTKNYNQFFEGECKSVRKIEILHLHNTILVFIDEEKILLTDMLTQLALNDGFNSVEDFFKWFNKDFTGKIIHWTDFRY